MTRKEITTGVFYSEIEGNYKKSRLSIYLASPLKRDNLTATALIPFLLERGTKEFPDMTLIKRKLNALYGANLGTSYSCTGFKRVIDGYIEGVDERLVGEGSALSEERTKLLLDVLFSPACENGEFNGEWLNVEREKLCEVIRAIINEKRDYCLKLLAENFFFADERSLPTDGFEEDLEGITGKSLYCDYEQFIKDCTVEIIYVGKRSAGLEETLTKAFSGLERSSKPKKELSPVPYGEEKSTVISLPVEQDKLALAFSCGRLLSEREMTALRVGCSLLGGTATSRLFMNVREKMSLCYYAAARVSYRSGGGITIDCGIDHKNTKKARAAIMNELESLAKDGATEKELTEVKLLFRNILSSVRDTSGSLSGYCYTSIEKYGRIVMPEEELEIIESITNEEIMDVLKLLHLNASSLIQKEDK